MSLSNPHPLWSTCGSNSFEISKAIVQAKMLSGRYRSDKLLKHFDKNISGQCSLCICPCEGSVEHLLISCPTLSQCRQQQFEMLNDSDKFSDTARTIITVASTNTVGNFVQLLLDCSALPEVIIACQKESKQVAEDIFKFSRTFCFNIHMKRMKLIGRWRNNFS